LKTLIALEILEKPLNEKLDPRWKLDRTLNVVPAMTLPDIERLDDNFAMLRKDTLEPNFTKFKVERALPIRLKERNERQLPRFK
jgi:hypothetical protein